MTILETMADPVLFGRWFRPWGSWAGWRAFLATLFALPMDAETLVVYQARTGRTSPPAVPFREAWLPVGRRGGKSRIVAFVATYVAAFRDYGEFLAPGERGIVMVTAADRRQARVVFGYVCAFFDGIPLLADLVESRTSDSLTLTNGVAIEVVTSSSVAVRGYTVVCFIGDEVGHWPADTASSDPAGEIFAAVRPATITIPTALILGMSSPRGKVGPLWEACRDHYGRDGDPILVWNADTRSMNPLAPEALIHQAFIDDPISAASEYGSDGRVEFRSDLEVFIARDVIEDAIVRHRHEVPPAAGVSYAGFVDPSGGSQDSMTLGVAHMEGARVIVDVLRERRPPFSPEDVVQEFVDVLQAYGVSRVVGDAYGGAWPREQFSKRGVDYELSEMTKSSLYRELLPILNGGRIDLPDNPRLVMQLAALERRVARGGRDSIDHPRGGHDDIANACAGVAVVLAKPMAFVGLIAYTRARAAAGRREPDRVLDEQPVPLAAATPETPLELVLFERGRP
jgi:hypothetical protein